MLTGTMLTGTMLTGTMLTGTMSTGTAPPNLCRASSQVIGKLIGGDVGAPQLLGPPRPSTAGPQAEDALAVADTEAGTAPGGGVLLDGFEAPAVCDGCTRATQVLYAICTCIPSCILLSCIPSCILLSCMLVRQTSLCGVLIRVLVVLSMCCWSTACCVATLCCRPPRIATCALQPAFPNPLIVSNHLAHREQRTHCTPLKMRRRKAWWTSTGRSWGPGTLHKTRGTVRGAVFGLLLCEQCTWAWVVGQLPCAFVL